MEEIVRPVGMHRSGFGPPAHGAVAVGYGEPHNGLRARQAPYDLRGFNPAGGLWSSVRDLAALVAWQQYVGPADTSHPLGGTTLAEMRSPAFLEPDWQQARGLPWELSRLGPHTVAGYGGAELGYAADLAFIPALDLGVVAAANADIDVRAIVHGVLGRVAAGLSSGPKSGGAAGTPMGDLARYTGRYSLPGVAVVDIGVTDGALTAGSPAAPGLVIQCTPSGPHTFLMDGGPMSGEPAVFEFDEAGPAVRMRAGPYTLVREDTSDHGDVL